MGLKKMLVMLFLVVLIAILVLINQDKKLDKNHSKQNVVLSTFALYDIASNITKERFNLSTVLPFGSDAHSFELTPKKMAQIQDADLFIYSGASLEPWISKISTSNRVDMSKYVELLHLEEGHHNHHEHDEHDMEGDEEVVDPHYWLDLDNMIKMAGVLTKELIKISPEDKDFFESNKEIYIDKLLRMDEKYKQELSVCKKDTIIVNHNAFSYLGKRYGFEIESVSGLSNDSMPSPSDIKHILHLIEDENISVIFFESFASDKLIKSIAKDTGVKVDTLQPLGNITKNELDLSFAQIMDDNIKKIKQALECR